MELQNMIDNIAKTCEELTEDTRAFEDYTEEEQAAYEDDKPGSKGVGAYFQDVYDIMYYIGSQGDFRGVKLCVAFGGPNVYVDTYTGEVSGAWGCSSGVASLSDGACDIINAYFEEVAACTVANLKD